MYIEHFENWEDSAEVTVAMTTFLQSMLWSGLQKNTVRLQSNLGLTDKCGPTTVRCWKKSVKRKRSVPHSVTIVCTSTANIAYHNASKRGIIMSLRQRSTISRFVGY